MAGVLGTGYSGLAGVYGFTGGGNGTGFVFGMTVSFLVRW